MHLLHRLRSTHNDCFEQSEANEAVGGTTKKKRKVAEMRQLPGRLTLGWLLAFLLIAGSSHPAPSVAGVTSVGVNAPADLGVSGSPVTSSGTITLSHSGQTCTAGACTITAGVVLGNASAGNVTADLPASNATRNPVEACKTDASANTVTLQPNGTDTIDNAASDYVLSAQHQCVKLVDTTVGNWSVRAERYLSIPSAKLAATGVTPGSYTNTNLTVNPQGQVTAAASGAAGTPGGALSNLQTNNGSGGFGAYGSTSCTNQAVTGLNTSGNPTCQTLTANYADSSLLKRANNLSDIPSPVMAATNLGLGPLATQTTPCTVAQGCTGASSAGATAANNIGALAKANNLSDLSSASSAVSSLGLGTAATLNTPIPVANGGTGIAHPGGTAGTGLSVSGSFPTQQYSLQTPVTVGHGGTGTSGAGATAANNIGALAEANNLSDLPNPSIAQSNLGLGTAATLNTPIPVANGGTGTASPGGTAGTGLNVSGSFPTQQYSLQTPVMVANGGTQCGAPSSFAKLPAAPVNGEICTVTNAHACIAGIAVSAGGGSVNCQLTYNGTSWMPAGGATTSENLPQLPMHQVTTSKYSQAVSATCDVGYPRTEWDFVMGHPLPAPPIGPTITIGGNCAQGQELIVDILQDSTGGVTPTFTAASGYTLNWQATGGTQPTITTAPNAQDGLKFQLSTYPSGNNLILWAWLPNTAPNYIAPGSCPAGQFVTATTTNGVICAQRG
jgi:hypothetical protein